MKKKCVNCGIDLLLVGDREYCPICHIFVDEEPKDKEEKKRDYIQ